MAKTVNCAFCGKEVKHGIFSKEEYVLGDVGALITCCEHCYNLYDMQDRFEFKRFATKVSNYKKYSGIKKISQEELVDLYKIYFEERLYYKDKCGNIEDLNVDGYFAYDKDYRFYMKESLAGKSSSNKDFYSANGVKDKEVMCMFTGEDVTFMEYRMVEKIPFAKNNIFCHAYLYEIHLNDPTVMTYRPSVVRVMAAGTSLLNLIKKKKKAERLVQGILLTLRNATKAQVEIVKVK